MTAETLTVPALKKFHRDPETRAAIAAVKAARVKSAEVSAHVASYIEPAFAAFEPFTVTLSPRLKNYGARIVKVSDLYLAGAEQEPQVERWSTVCDELHRAHGYEGLEPGQCPALTADHACIKAENRLLELFERLIGERCVWTLERRAKVLDLLLNPPRG